MNEHLPLLQLSPSRNDPLGFATRTRKNLEGVEAAYTSGADVHVVTQLMLSLLGLIVFPEEDECFETITPWRLDELEDSDWPKWNILLGTSDTLGELIRHLRNAVAHRHVTFSSDSRNISEVTIEFTDQWKRNSPPTWRAQIEAIGLRKFCLQLNKFIEEDAW